MRGPLIAGLANIAVLSALFIGNVVWKWEKGCHGAALKYVSDAPPGWDYSAHANGSDSVGYDDGIDEEHDDRNGNSAVATSATGTTVDGYPPSHLQWKASKLTIPDDWRFVTPEGCPDFADNFDRDGKKLGDQKIIVHVHLRHNAGTRFYNFAKQFTPCATVSCLQDSKHCMVSYNEEVEAENIRNNYREHGVQFVSYELMLPPRFPLPFVSETARRGLFFTTIVRDPFKRFLTYVRRQKQPDRGHGAKSPFWIDIHGKSGTFRDEDNLNARWLSGAQGKISSDHVNVAKCRLQLFDLVIADKLMDHATKKVICPLNGWKGRKVCDGEVAKKEHDSKADKSDPLRTADVDPLLIGAWAERLRPDFEIYDYARILSWRQLRERGVEDLPELSEVPSYLATLAGYAGSEVTDAHLKRIPSVSLAHEDQFSPPVGFCNEMKRIWTSNPDEVPDAFGIGTILKGFHP